MNRTSFVVLCMLGHLFWSSSASASYIVFEGVDSATVTTGDLLDGTDELGRTVEVAEISGLFISARSGASTQVLNATTGSFGINADGSGDDTDAFDSGESMILSFKKDIRINLLDFNLFDDVSESFSITVGGLDSFTIGYNDLSNKTSGWIATNLVVTAGTEIEFSTSSPTPIGLDGIDLDVIPEPAVAGLIGLVCIGVLVVRRFVD